MRALRLSFVAHALACKSLCRAPRIPSKLTRIETGRKKAGKGGKANGKANGARTAEQIAAENALIDGSRCYISRLPNELLTAVLVTLLHSYPAWELQKRRRSASYVSKTWRKACAAIAMRDLFVTSRDGEDFAKLHWNVTSAARRGEQSRALDIVSFTCELPSNEATDKQLVEVLALATNVRSVEVMYCASLDLAPALLGRPGLQQIKIGTPIDGQTFRQHLDVNPSLRHFSFEGISGERENGTLRWSIEAQSDSEAASIIAAIAPDIFSLTLSEFEHTSESLAQLSRCVNLEELEAEVASVGSEAYITQLRTQIQHLPLRHLGLSLQGGPPSSETVAAVMQECLTKTVTQLTFRGSEDRYGEAMWLIKPADVRRVLDGLTRPEHRRTLTIGDALTGEDDELWTPDGAADLMELADSRNISLEVYE